MERFPAIVTAQRAAHVQAPTAPSNSKVESKGKGKGKVVEEDAAYLSIQLEEIVIVKNDADAYLGAARGRSTLAGGFSSSSSMGQRVAAAAAAPSGMSTAAARGALSTTVGWIVGSDH